MHNNKVLSFEQCENRTLLSPLVIILNGNAYSPAGPNNLTANAALILAHDGCRTLQLGYGKMNTAAAFGGLEHQVAHITHGQSVSIVGFSAGGTLALRLAFDKTINVKSVLDYYGPPNVRDYFAYHGHDRFAQYVQGHVGFTHAGIAALSGPMTTSAHVVCAFGLKDINVVASQSIASLNRDLSRAVAYTYDGGHGVGISTCQPALDEFLSNLG